MATYNATHSGGGTAGHPSSANKVYVLTSPVYDAVDNTDLEQGDIVQLFDIPADTMIVGGCVENLEASGNEQITYDVGITGGDVDMFVDGADSDQAAGYAVPFLMAASGAQDSNPVLVTTADTVDLLVIDGGSSKTTAWRFRAHIAMADISRNPVESATVSTGT